MSMLASFLLLYVSLELMEALPLLHINLVMKCCNLWLLFVVSVTCFSSYSRACPPVKCDGGREFGYPFGWNNSGCGDPLLQLQCDKHSNMPLLDINGSQYYILDYLPHFNSSASEGIVMIITDKNQMERECDPSSSNSMQGWSDTLFEECEDAFQNKTLKLRCNASFYYNTSSEMNSTGKCKSEVHLFVKNPLDPNRKEFFELKIKRMPSSSYKHFMSDKGVCAYEADITSNPSFCKPRGDSSSDVLQEKHEVGAIAGVTAGIALLLIVALLLLVAFRKRASSSASKVEKFLKEFTHEMPTRYSYSQLKKISNNFAEKLGEGGFGVVYKGKLSKGNLVAVKILDQSRQSESQFMNEVATIGRIHHLHLVRLMGYCFEGFKSALVYEYMANGSLEKFVFMDKEKRQILSWEQLYSIALGAARGIAYLHEDCERRIIHFDIKPHNILLDANFTAKVSDFGLAKLCRRLDDHVSVTAIRGTPGYVAPELWCKNLGPITDKADVYSFGMMLLEIVGGRKNIDVQVSRSSALYFPDWAFKLLEKGELEERLRGRFRGEIRNENDSQVLKMCKVGLWCIQYNSIDRPTMSKVVQMLEGNGDEVSNPPFPFNSAASPQPQLMSCSDESSSM